MVFGINDIVRDPPNPYQTKADFAEDFLYKLMVYGNVFVDKRETGDMYLLDAKHMTIGKDGYDYSINDQTIHYNRDEIIQAVIA